MFVVIDQTGTTLQSVQRGDESVSAVVLSYNRRDVVATTLDRLGELPIDEIVVVDNASTDGTQDVVRAHPANVRLIELADNTGIAARNVAAAVTTGDFLLSLDDDSFPNPGAIELMLEAFRRDERIGVVGGLLNDRGSDGQPVPHEQPGSFDWWLRGAHRGDVPPEGLPSTFFPEGASMLRHSAFNEVGGWFEPYRFDGAELDLAARMLRHGWEVRYLPTAAFEHLRRPNPDSDHSFRLRLRVRNRLWYFWLRYPRGLALRRIPAYLLFDLAECLYRGEPAAWAHGVWAAWRDRALIAGRRTPMTRAQAQRAEAGRARQHLVVLPLSAVRVLRRRLG